MKKSLKLKRNTNGICKFTSSFKAFLEPRNLSITTGAISLAAFGGYFMVGPAGPDNLLRELLFKKPATVQAQSYEDKNLQENPEASLVRSENQSASVSNDRSKYPNNNKGNNISQKEPCDIKAKAIALYSRDQEIAAENQRHNAALKGLNAAVSSNNQSDKKQAESEAHSNTVHRIEQNYRTQLNRLNCN